MKILINKDAEIKIDILIGQDPDGDLRCWEKSESKPEDVKDSTIESHTVVFRYPTFKDNMLFLDSSLKVSSSGEVMVVSNQLKYTRLVTLLKSWSFLDDSGKPIPVTEEYINLIDPEILEILVSSLEKVING
jgi:hypothetical protein